MKYLRYKQRKRVEVFTSTLFRDPGWIRNPEHAVHVP